MSDDISHLDSSSSNDIPIPSSLSDIHPPNLIMRAFDVLVQWLLQNPKEFMITLLLFMGPLFIFGAWSAYRLIQEIESSKNKKIKSQRLYENKKKIASGGKKAKKTD